MSVNLYEVGIPMLSDQAYYVGIEEFKEGFLRAADKFKELPSPSSFFSILSFQAGLLASSETGDIRFKTKSKNERISADDWPKFTVDKEIYDEMVNNSPSLKERLDLSRQEGKGWVKKGLKTFIEPSDIAVKDRRRIVSKFYRSLTPTNSQISIVPAYFQPELCYQVFNTLINDDDLLGEMDDYRVLDPTAGWGDRMIGFALTSYITKKKIYYHANDMNAELEIPYSNLIDKLSHIEGLSEYFIPTFTIQDALYLEIGSLGDGEWDFVDLIFTSPPYYDMEDTIRGGIVHKDPDNIDWDTADWSTIQDDIAYKDYEDWEELWLRPFIGAMHKIDDGTILALHVAETNRAHLVTSVRKIASWMDGQFVPRTLGWNLDYGKRPVILFGTEE